MDRLRPFFPRTWTVFYPIDRGVSKEFPLLQKYQWKFLLKFRLNINSDAEYECVAKVNGVSCDIMQVAQWYYLHLGFKRTPM